MQIKRIQEKFQEIGATLAFTETVQSRYTYEPPAPFTLSVTKDRRGRTAYTIAILPKAHEHIEIEVHTVDKKAKQLILNVRLFDEHQQFICGKNEGKWDIAEIPPGPAGIKRAAKILNEQKRLNDEQEAQEREDNRYRCMAARPKHKPTPSHAEVYEIVPIDDEGYDFYRAIIDKCKKLKIHKGDRYAVAQYDNVHANTFEIALMRVADHHKQKIRDVDTWKPKSKNPNRQFSSLIRHLFAKYPVPQFMDTVWFRNDEQWIPWFIQIGQGTNIRKVDDFPLTYTKKMAQNMMQSPNNYTIEKAIRWGQVSALGANKRFFNEIESTRIFPIEPIGRYTAFQHSFWQTIIQFLLLHPMLDPAHYGPIIDYIQYQKFIDPCPNPDFQITGRTPQALLRLVDEWHGELGQQQSHKKSEWNSHNLDWTTTQKTKTGDKNTWKVHEILDSTELLEEGRQMHHCVYTYTVSCQKGRSIILSLRRDEERLLTIEYLPNQQRMGEIRGPYNRLPKNNELNILSRWANEKGLQKAWLLMT